MKSPIVISASRRTDLVGCYPDALIARLKEYPPDTVHSLVIWTKNPLPLLNNIRLRKAVQQYTQMYIHVTVTGMGGGIFEPRIPKPEKVLAILPELITLAGDPRRIVWRFDPIVHFKKKQKKYSNLSMFSSLAKEFAENKIRAIKTSWVSPYQKVIRNLNKFGWELEDISLEQKKKEALGLEKIARAGGQCIEYCCVEGFALSRCIDGFRLIELHPSGQACSTKRARHQRTLCGCTESIDIGWYTQTCLHGCVYCYANPKIQSD